MSLQFIHYVRTTLSYIGLILNQTIPSHKEHVYTVPAFPSSINPFLAIINPLGDRICYGFVVLNESY